MASKYFSCLDLHLSYVKEYDRNKNKVYELDLDILQTLCKCLEEWESCTNDKLRKETMKSIITGLKVIWVEENHMEDHFEEAWPKYIQDLDPLTFELEGKIQQSKKLIDQQWWCQYLVRSSSMQYKSSTHHHTIYAIVKSVTDNLRDLLIYRAAEIVLFKNQIDILKDMLLILRYSFDGLYNHTNSLELQEYRNFVLAFSNNAACLTSLYWAKEATDEIATEINTVLFDMLHKIKPFAADVMASYFGGALNSNNFLSEDYLEGRNHARFVDFFFEETILKDDFLILRERLIFLFTFLTDAPHEKSQEEDVIRNQFFSLFREDTYLLLPINEMKEDVSDNKILLSDFVIKIDILNTKIIQPSDSWNILETEKMNSIYFASLQRELCSIVRKHATISDRVRAQAHVDPYLMEIRFLRSLVFPCFKTWDDSDEETRVQLQSVVTTLQRIWGQEYDMGLSIYAIRKADITDYDHLLALELKEKFQMSKQEISAWLVSLSHSSFRCRPSTSNKILEFTDSIYYRVKDLDDYGAYKDDELKKQIEIFDERPLLLHNLLKLATNCVDSKSLEVFNMFTQAFANNVACLIYVYWEKEANGVETNLMLSKMFQKTKPNTPDIARIYIDTLKAICSQPYDSFLFEQTVMSFVDYFFEDLVATWKNDFQSLRDDVIFYLTFIHHHHHTGNAEEIICNQLDVLFGDGVYGLLPFDDMKGDYLSKKSALSDFMMSIQTEHVKIIQLYCRFPDSFVYNFPRIIGEGFLDSLMQKTRNLTERMTSDQKSIPFAKYKIMTLEKELVYLTPTFYRIRELKDLNAVLLEVVNVVYLAEHVISLCLIFYHLLCHYIPHLSDIVDKVNIVRTKLEKIEECNIYNDRSLSRSAGFISRLSEQDHTSKIQEVVVGFEVDEKIIMDNITNGTESLDIVSIVGMGGLGKTTLAKKIYDSSSVKSHFNIYAFTYVSQDHDKRRLLLDILRYVDGVDDNTSGMTEDDLAHKLKKCLGRRKYFIVLDDIWNISAWDEVRSSFPDDRNGSRVMFTTRSLEVANRGYIKSSPHHLRFLTEDESLKLLQMKLFHNDMPPPNLFGVVELVAKKCHGLPLAIVAIAGLLATTETSLWIEISKRVSSCLFDQGCMNILELSYKHLPEYLKPCLLYLGAFPEDESYKVRQVTLLWIAEGFIKESKTKSLNDVAKEYLNELANRSLIIVEEMTIGEIRTFRVHDLIHDLCQKKCFDNNFFQLGYGSAKSSFSTSNKYSHYRVSVQKLYEPLLTNTRSLLCLSSNFDYYQRIFPLSKFRFAQVLYLKGIRLQTTDFEHMTSLNDLRHIEAEVDSGFKLIPSSISNLSNMQSLILRKYKMSFEKLYLPETLWRMKSLRHVKVHDHKFEVSDGYKLNAYPQLDKVVSFSRPYLFTGKDVEWLLQRLPAVQELDCILEYKSLDYIEERVETFDFHKRELESLKILCKRIDGPYIINFPSTLVKLTLDVFELSWTAISAITELQCLRILKLRDVSFPEPTWMMEDLTFPNLKYFELCGGNLKLWNASIESFPLLEELFCLRIGLDELPLCFGELASLKKITINGFPTLQSSALGVQEEQKDLGNKVELRLI